MRYLLPAGNDTAGRGYVASNPVTGDLVPLCDQHHAPMFQSSALPLIFHGCTGDQSCERRYDDLLGYCRATSPTMTYRVLCHIHFKALYMCDYDSDRHLRRYACPVHGCKIGTEWLPAGLGASLD